MLLSLGQMRWLLLALLLQPGDRGALTQFGNQWGWAGTQEAFVPQLVMYATPPNFYGNPGKVDADVRMFLDTYGFNGFHVFVSCRWFDIGEPDCREADGTDPPLDPRTFEALRMLIEKTYAAGGMVHIWMWGDEERGQTPSARDDWGGLGGPVARRVEAAIAERLGPLPGWSLGYGFDLDEWVETSEIHAWRERMHRLLPSFHFMGGRPQGPNNGRNHRRYAAWNRGLDYASYEHHKPSYAVYVEALESNPDKPVMSEDRFRVLPSDDRKHYSPQEIRRGLYHSTLAGGVANIWGHLEDGGSHELGSAPFPNRGQIRTYFELVRGRFLAGMVRCSSAKANPARTSLCLGDGGEHYLFYREDGEQIDLDLRNAKGALPVVAVDTKKPYEELPLGRYAPGRHQWKAPYRSDWALAAGSFAARGRDRSRATGEARAPSQLSVRPTDDGATLLEWVDGTGGTVGADVERALGDGVTPGRFETLATLPPGETRFIDRGAPAGVTYWYRVGAAGGAGPYSEARRVSNVDAGSVLSGLRPSSYEIAAVSVGARYYVDRDYTLASIPSFLQRGVLVRTANDDKLARDERFLSFELGRPATLYVGFDRRAHRVPYWLDEWEHVDGRLSVEGDGMRYFELYRRDVLAGPVALGGNSAAGGEWRDDGKSHYIVVVVPE